MDEPVPYNDLPLDVEDGARAMVLYPDGSAEEYQFLARHGIWIPGALIILKDQEEP